LQKVPKNARQAAAAAAAAAVIIYLSTFLCQKFRILNEQRIFIIWITRGEFA